MVIARKAESVTILLILILFINLNLISVESIVYDLDVECKGSVRWNTARRALLSICSV